MRRGSLTGPAFSVELWSWGGEIFVGNFGGIVGILTGAFLGGIS